MSEEAELAVNALELQGTMVQEMELPADILLQADDDDGLPSQHDLVVEDEQQQTETLAALDTMRKNRHFCDVVLNVGSSEIHAHRIVLASASPYLHELFTADDENKSAARENKITYRLNGGLDKVAFERLIDFAYTSRLHVPANQVKSVYLAACQLKMDKVIQVCSQYLIQHLDVKNCIEIRSLPGINKNKQLVAKVDRFINKQFDLLSKSPSMLNLPCIQIEVLNQTREEMSLVIGESLCQLVLDWVQRQSEEHPSLDHLSEKTHLLYLALDNSLQDCMELPSGEVSDSDIVQDYKKLSKRQSQSNLKNRRKSQLQPAKPRILVYSRDISDKNLTENQNIDWDLIANTKVQDHTFMALVSMAGALATLSVVLRLNRPKTPSPTNTPGDTAPGSRLPSEEKPDLYCVLPNMSHVKCAAGCANLNETLLVCGGYDRGECLKSVESYSPDGNIWATLAPMKEARGRFDIAVSGGKVFAVGGSNGTTELPTVEMYDPMTKKWSRMASLPLARSNAGVCDLEGKVYCIGGWNGQVGIKQCDVFDPKTNDWRSVAPLLTGRYQAGVCSFDGKVYAVGGCDAWNCLNSVEFYDPATDSWCYIKSMITSRRGCGLAVFKGKLYAVGGSDGSHSLTSTEIYDTETETWTPGPSMTTPRANVGVAVIGNRLYAVGGFSGKTFLNSIEYLDEFTDEWTTFVPKQDLHYQLSLPSGSDRTSKSDGSSIASCSDSGSVSE
ncbi:influenza virus NS1A-binding protein homolog A-like isoform X2 [Neocloeon triangulifer]|uniref:influenza virus NS1A-binding protein homolog A-like isoform X2 n=1 Tax=Neocloeon triangulifer TaxID=2078957 RepID=UPI00286F43EA|nr:influenza virus NS1A-binding protein homolog A-like isoform X2 [Neocloeon triangulifer]